MTTTISTIKSNQSRKMNHTFDLAVDRFTSYCFHNKEHQSSSIQRRKWQKVHYTQNSQTAELPYSACSSTT